MPTNRKLLPARRPKFQRHAMVPFLGTEAADVATFWFFGLRQAAAEASASGTSTAAAEGSIATAQVIVGAAGGSGFAAATPTRIFQTTVAGAGVASATGAAIRWSQQASGSAAGSGLAAAAATCQFQ